MIVLEERQSIVWLEITRLVFYNFLWHIILIFQLSEIDLHDSILIMGFSNDLKDELLRLYKENCREIRAILSKMSMDLPHYHNLEWRLDVEVSRPTLHPQPYLQSWTTKLHSHHFHQIMPPYQRQKLSENSSRIVGGKKCKRLLLSSFDEDAIDQLPALFILVFSTMLPFGFSIMGCSKYPVRLSLKNNMVWLA